MVHYGKHIIEPETGLCEICDRGAIHDFRRGKRTGKQFFYSNQDGKFTYRSNDDDDIHHNPDETPRYVRKPLYPEPPPRPRPIVHEEAVVVQKKSPRRHHSPIDDNHHSSPSRPTTFYYVDNTGQMIPRNGGPPEEPRRQYVVQNHHSPPTTRPTRVVPRRAQTPPPPASEPFRTRPKRQTNSDIDVVQHPHQTKSNAIYHNQSPRKAEMYYLDKTHHENHHSTISSLVQTKHDTNKKQRQLEPMERKHYPEPEPTVIRKVYKKLPASKYEPQQAEYIPNGHQSRPVRKVEKIYPSPRTYESSPQLTNRHIKSPLMNTNPSVYYIRSVDEY